ncbi:circadian clock-controlled protein daywake-like [Tenebrio molitor]|uniref:circadian clock-controlled protein daywake-like n=1 Tax=Tenebrio molitor TaxID=7067 RepID=UPI0036249B73
MKTFLLFGLLFLIKSCSSLTMPYTFKRCDKRTSDFNDCLSDAIQDAISQLDRPMEEYGLPSLEPLQLSNVSPRLGRKVDFQHSYKNFKIYGRTKISKTKANMNFYDKTLAIQLTNPEVRYEFDYEAKGKMFLLPIDTSGHATVILHNVTYDVTYMFGEHTKDNKKYFQVIDFNFEMKPQDVTLLFQNLLKDKELNDAFSRAMSKDWKQVFGGIGYLYAQTYGKTYSVIFNNFLSKVPITEIFNGVN